MDAQIKQKWVEALRSGKYQQGQGILKGGNEYCCLGVLCEVMGATFYSGSPVLLSNSQTLKRSSGDELLNRNALQIVGMTERDQDMVAKMNDGGKSFANIADHIEEHL
jgi:hypothetical protein